jgi:hypothetical protein
MATTEQNASIYRGAGRVLRIACVDAAGDPLELTGLSLHYRVALTAKKLTLLALSGIPIEDGDVTLGEAAAGYPHVAVVTITRERSLTLPAKTLYHELYATDGNPAQNDDVVLMTGALTVLAAQIAQHDV